MPSPKEIYIHAYQDSRSNSFSSSLNKENIIGCAAKYFQHLINPHKTRKILAKQRQNTISIRYRILLENKKIKIGPMGEKKNSTATKEDANDKQNTRTRTSDDDDDNNNNNNNSNQDEAIGQGKLYSPEHAIKVSSSHQEGEEDKESSGDMIGVAADIKRQMGLMKDKVIEKLTAASVPSDALDNTRHFLESVVRDVTVAAHGLTKDALSRIKTHLVDLLPSLSPSLTTKMVDDAEEEAKEECGKEKGGKEQEDNQQRMKAPYASPASSFFANLAKPLSRL